MGVVDRYLTAYRGKGKFLKLLAVLDCCKRILVGCMLEHNCFQHTLRIPKDMANDPVLESISTSCGPNLFIIKAGLQKCPFHITYTKFSD